MHRWAVCAGVALGVTALVGCAAAAPRPMDAPRDAPRVSASFAVAAFDAPTERRRHALLTDPALQAMLRHRRMTGAPPVTADALLNDVLKNFERSGALRDVLDHWRTRTEELAHDADRSAAYLPQGHAFRGRIHLVVGYDIGVAAPPDIVLNVAHAHFQKSPAEVGYYATHEAHHVGFLSLRPMPSMDDLSNPGKLRDLIRFMTQMEGMAVHAAYAQRAGDRALGGDDDYRVYTDPAYAQAISRRYAEVMALTEAPGPLPDATVGQVLTAMSSGERLWYRVGALLAWRLEQTRGRAALIASITAPDSFWSGAEGTVNP